MDLLNEIVRFIRDDLLITLSVIGGALLITSWNKKRSLPVLRSALVLLVIFFWMYLTKVLPNGREAQAALIRYLGFFALSVTAVMFIHKCSFYSALYGATVSYSIQNMCENLVEIPRETSLFPSFPVVADRLLLFLLMAFFFYVFCRTAVWHNRHQRYIGFERMDRRMILIISAISVSLCIVLNTLARPVTSAGDDHAKTVVHLMLALCSGLIVLVSNSYRREADSEKRAQIAALMLTSEQERYQREKQVQDAINVKCHDIRHQIRALGEEGRQTSLKEIGKLVHIYDSTVKTGNTALDVVLSDKVLICRQQEITFTCMADGKHLAFIPDGDIFALFGNILDNAINAAEKLADPAERIISLTVRADGGFVLIEEENRYAGDMSFENGLPQTNSEDKQNHGFGMQSIQMLTERYNGSLRIDAQNGIFMLSIMFPIYE